MDYRLIVRTDHDGMPRIDEHQTLPPHATITITGSEDDDPWSQLVFLNDVVVDTGAVTGTRIITKSGW